ncbi:hypothetical protein H112_08299 [Trichophyton rubrum D6]|uniref:Uncharacterized protein n=2 Tax=Trichophyton rubrum TaxID=5551 RepID=A0A080WE34_TRIRC|nr:uncharacterized protein TERG_11646 [Trichophyton rubrum CBS 118892]EZF10477.1 hypothetical protein H100_08321 [Trichophyton rubrum MR850]EZF37329.1 hypothetical protein H102_08280 [Trichophyton rubrum CBS 100081]EZF47954.1 hypothetical protein H103_08304 [Trichophyton rubrum CBS 288.86]EZF58576.1 hypothetical protein H104_08254 [Trichophyton rubrum CBS 289.86]EZF79957.1 hypothetical protein H110_08303 [Trichophyton rubrum MR1448]EZF90597.1 hypothetical protein H113_08372 [Trichophyton rubr
MEMTMGEAGENIPGLEDFRPVVLRICECLSFRLACWSFWTCTSIKVKLRRRDRRHHHHKSVCRDRFLDQRPKIHIRVPYSPHINRYSAPFHIDAMSIVTESNRTRVSEQLLARMYQIKRLNRRSTVVVLVLMEKDSKI